MSGDEFSQIIQEIASEWNTAEKAVKHAENVDGEVVFPAIQELRYAGRRLVDALAIQESDPMEAVALARDAKFFCHRARHDAIDAATQKMAGDLAVAVEYLSAGIIMEKFAKFPTFYRSLLKIRDRVAISRENREDRDKIYNTIQSVDLDKLVELYDEFRTCEPLIYAASEQEKKDRRRSERKGNIGIALGVLGIVIGFILWWIG